MANEKIGMCCACGDQMSKTKTIWARGMEWCPTCAEMADVEDESEDED